MLNINIPIDDYINNTFLLKKEEMIVLPKRKVEENKKCINISLSLEELLNKSDGNVLCAISDGFINGYIESQKDIVKELLKLDYSYDEIIEITQLSIESIYEIENEL